MKFLLENKKTTMKYLIYLSIFFFSGLSFSQDVDCILEKTPKQDLVQDYAELLTPEEEQSIRSILEAFNDTVSNQILVITVKDLCGYDRAEFTYSLGEKYGVGQKDKDNGVVIMVKPKVGNSRGQAFIATGYGLEGALPDAICKRIVETEMIPNFKKNDYYSGILAAVHTTTRLTSGEFTAEEFVNKNKSNKGLYSFIIVFIILFAIFKFANHKQTKKYAAAKGISYAAAAAILAKRRRNSSTTFTSTGFGGGFGGGSSGGFGGFGGGSFGGGGAGGSW